MLEITRFSNVSIVDFEQVNISWECSFILLNARYISSFYLSVNHFHKERSRSKVFFILRFSAITVNMM